jgi:hypothetical protein
MVKPTFKSNASGDFMAVTDTSDARSWRVGEQFTRGDLPGYLMILWFASQHIFGLTLLACLIAAIASPLLYRKLKRHAHQRLQDKSHHE